MTRPDAEKFVVAVRDVKDGGELDAKFDGRPVSGLKVAAAGAIREPSSRAQERRRDEVEVLAVYGQRGCTGVKGALATAKHSDVDDSDDENETQPTADVEVEQGEAENERNDDDDAVDETSTSND